MKGLDRHEKVFSCTAPAASVREPAAGDDVMDVGMIEQLARPAVQYSHHAQTAAEEPWVLSQLQQSFLSSLMVTPPEMKVEQPCFLVGISGCFSEV